VVYRRKVLGMDDPKYKTLSETLEKNILGGKYGVGMKVRRKGNESAHTVC